MSKIKNDYLVEKRNILNEVMWNEKMTLQSLRFFSLYLSKINAQNPNMRKVSFSIKEFMSIMGFKGVWSKAHYKSTVRRLLSQVAFRDLENGGLECFTIFKKVVLQPDENGNWCIEMEASEEAIPYMFEFKNRYFTYELWNVLHLKSVNALRMYEILKQYEFSGERTISLEKLKLLLGIRTDEYREWQDFKKRVLNSCQKALLEKTDIKYTYEPIRKGRGGKVTGLKFKIEKNTEFDRQMTFEEFMSLDRDSQFDFEKLSDENVIVIETDKQKNSKTRRRIKPEKKYTLEELEALEEYAEVCQGKFTDMQIQALHEILTHSIPESKRVDGGYRKAYLQEAYCILLDKEKQEKVKYRFAYLKKTLQNILAERTLEK